MAFGQSDFSVEENAYQLFRDFMTRVTEFEELGKMGYILLSKFQQALELFRRTSLNESSKLLADIVKKNDTERLKSYMKAGCRHFHIDTQLAVKLNKHLQDLKMHLEEASLIRNDIQHLLNTAVRLMEEVTISMLNSIDLHSDPSKTESYSTELEEPTRLPNRKMEISDIVAMMMSIYRMLKQDYDMQEKIITELQLDLSSEVLESYLLMWSLHPFIDNHIINKALLSL